MRRTVPALLLLAGVGCAGDTTPGAGPDADPVSAPGLDLASAAAIAVHPGDLAPADYAPDTLLVGFDQATLPDRLRIAGVDAVNMGTLGPLPVARYVLPRGTDLQAAAEEAQRQPGVAFVEADLVRRATAVADPYRGFQWNFDAVAVDDAHDVGATGRDVIVAVIDTGVSGAGQEAPNLVAGYDFIDDDADADDPHGHGTHVAGTIAAPTGDGVGVAGVAPDARIMPVRVLDASGSGTTSGVISGIVWAVENGAQILNLSLGSASASAAELLAVEWAVEQGVLVVAASGNDAAGTVGYPAGYDAALAVGATDAANGVAPYSNTGSALDIVAPGGDLSADLNGDGYGDGVLQETIGGSGWGWYFFQGTSMATPHVAGAAALLVGLGATPAEAGDALLDSTDDLLTEGWDEQTGHGLLDAGQAVADWMAAQAPTEDEPEAPEEDPTPEEDAPVEDEPEAPEEDPTPEEDAPEEDAPGTPDEDRPGDDDGQDETGEPDREAPQVLRMSARRDGSRVALRFVTDEPATAEICNARRTACVETDLRAVHRVFIEQDSRVLLVRISDAAGNTRTLDPIRVRPGKGGRG